MDHPVYKPDLVPELLCEIQRGAGVVEPSSLQPEVCAEAEAELDGVDVVAPAILLVHDGHTCLIISTG